MRRRSTASGRSCRCVSLSASALSAQVIFSAHFTLYPYLVGGATSTAFAASNKLSQPDVPGVSNSIDKRMLLILVLQCCWSLRLSYNTFRRGLFSMCVCLTSRS